MPSLEQTQQVPLVVGEDGTIRVAGSRVTLESIIHEFDLGATAEQIQEDFPSLALRDVYAVIAYYLGHLDAVKDYMQGQDHQAGQVRGVVETAVGTPDLRRRLRERRTHPVK